MSDNGFKQSPEDSPGSVSFSPRLRLVGFVVLCALAFGLPLLTGPDAAAHNQAVAWLVYSSGILAGFVLLRLTCELDIRWHRWNRLAFLVGGIVMGAMICLLLATHFRKAESLALFAALLALGVVWLRRPFSAWNIPPLATLALGILLAVAAATGILAAYPHIALLGDHYRHTGLLSIVCCALLFLLAAAVFSHPPALPRASTEIFFGALFGGAAVVSVVALLQFFLPIEVWGRWFFTLHQDPRPMATLGHPNWLGTYVCLVFPLAAWSFLRREGRILRPLLAVLCCLLFATLLVAQTRGAWVACAVVGIWVAFAQRETKGRLLTLGVLLAVVALILLPQKDGEIFDRLLTFGKESQRAAAGAPGTGSGRFMFWLYAIEHLPRYWLLGSGLDTYLLVAPPDSPLPPLNKAHSLFLEYALTLGIPGLLAYLAFLVGCFGWPRAGDASSFGWALRASIAAYLLQGIFLHDTLSNLPLVWILAGFAAANGLGGKMGLSRSAGTGLQHEGDEN